MDMYVWSHACLYVCVYAYVSICKLFIYKMRVYIYVYMHIHTNLREFLV